jgi:hypothetical protein
VSQDLSLSKKKKKSKFSGAGDWEAYDPRERICSSDVIYGNVKMPSARAVH